MPDPHLTVVAKGLTKTFGTTTALDGIDLEVPRGTVLGVLGPNGAGKTTTVRVLSTLLRPDAGQAWVAGHDVLADPDAVRRSIGLSGQYAAVDENLTGYENLYLFARLYGMSRSDSADRAKRLLGRFQLTEVATRLAKTYSGGMRRRLDLASALIGDPAVVILDEPTTGLDPRGRMDTWAVLGELVSSGISLLLTTQYLEEADQFADSIVVIDKGKVIAEGTADELKAQTGGERLELTLADPADVPLALRALAGIGIAEPAVDETGRQVSVPVDAGSKALMEALRRFDAQAIAVQDVTLRRPSLDDVFMLLTDDSAAEPELDPESPPVAAAQNGALR